MVAACWDSQEQLERHLVTMTSLPESRWRNLFNLDVIKVTGFSAQTCSSPYKLSPHKLSPYKLRPYQLSPYKLSPYQLSPYKLSP